MACRVCPGIVPDILTVRKMKIDGGMNSTCSMWLPHGPGRCFFWTVYFARFWQTVASPDNCLVVTKTAWYRYWNRVFREYRICGFFRQFCFCSLLSAVWLALWMHWRCGVKYMHAGSRNIMPGCGQRQASVSCGNGTKSSGAANSTKQKKPPFRKGEWLAFWSEFCFFCCFFLCASCVPTRGTTLI